MPAHAYEAGLKIVLARHQFNHIMVYVRHHRPGPGNLYVIIPRASFLNKDPGLISIVPVLGGAAGYFLQAMRERTAGSPGR